MKSPVSQALEQIALVMKKRRISLNLKQHDAAKKAGVSLGSLRVFEQTGKISFERFIALCWAYRMDDHLLNCLDSREYWSLDEIKRAEKQKTIR